jgi:hypothetical protein
MLAPGTALAEGWELYRNEDGWQLRGAESSATVNGTVYQTGQILDTGDEIVIGTGGAATLIEVRT